MKLKSYIKQQGFSLVELAIVLVILGFVLGALLLPLRAQRDQAAQIQTQNTLELAKQALLGFAQANGRLPCPALAGSGVAAPNASGPCTQQVGFLPATTLGLQPVNAQGFAIDAWNNPIRYAVTQSDVNITTGVATLNPVFTTSNGVNNAGIANLSQSANLRVCASSSTFSTTCSAPPISGENNYLVNNAVAVIFSTGQTEALEANTLPAIVRPDETENLDTDTVFVSRDISTAAAPNEFDHLVTWISPYVLYNAMIQAGQLH
ncbi:MAG: type II secretion system protein [Bdellovibrio sp.]|nr:type II secretion system protein [Methylotenera sp.]